MIIFYSTNCTADVRRKRKILYSFSNIKISPSFQINTSVDSLVVALVQLHCTFQSLTNWWLVFINSYKSGWTNWMKAKGILHVTSLHTKTVEGHVNWCRLTLSSANWGEVTSAQAKEVWLEQNIWVHLK